MQAERPRDEDAELLVVDDQPCTYVLVKTKDCVSPSSLEVYFTVPAREEVFVAGLYKTYDSTEKTELLKWLHNFDFYEEESVVIPDDELELWWKDDEAYHVFMVSAEAVYDREREVHEAFLPFNAIDEHEMDHESFTETYYGYTPGDLQVIINSDGLTAMSSDWDKEESTTIFKPTHLKIEDEIDSSWLDTSKVQRLKLGYSGREEKLLSDLKEFDTKAFESLEKASFYSLAAFSLFTDHFSPKSLETVKLYLEDDESLTGEAVERLNEMPSLTGIKLFQGNRVSPPDSLEVGDIKVEYARLFLDPVSTTFPNAETLVLHTKKGEKYMGLFGTCQDWTVVGIVDLTRIDEYPSLRHVVCSRFSGHLGIYPMTDLNVKINKSSAKNARSAYVEP